MKTKLVVKPENKATRFDEQSFLSTIHGSTPRWDYKHYIEHINQKIVNLSTTNKIYLKCDVTDGSVVKGLRYSRLYSFVLVKKPGFKVF